MYSERYSFHSRPVKTTENHQPGAQGLGRAHQLRVTRYHHITSHHITPQFTWARTSTGHVSQPKDQLNFVRTFLARSNITQYSNNQDARSDPPPRSARRRGRLWSKRKRFFALCRSVSRSRSVFSLFQRRKVNKRKLKKRKKGIEERKKLKTMLSR